MTRLAPIEVRRAGRDEPPCPRCGQPAEHGQRLALVLDEQLGHVWLHLRHIVEPDRASQEPG
jgi:hypothetical protein